MKTIILGVGNPILCDDGIGIHVAKKLHDLNGPACTSVGGVQLDVRRPFFFPDRCFLPKSCRPSITLASVVLWRKLM